jgi:hypothetical protein
MYFFLGGMLDGRAGFAWCTLQAFYEYLILLKVEEIKQMQTTAIAISSRSRQLNFPNNAIENVLAILTQSYK